MYIDMVPVLFTVHNSFSIPFDYMYLLTNNRTPVREKAERLVMHIHVHAQAVIRLKLGFVFKLWGHGLLR